MVGWAPNATLTSRKGEGHADRNFTEDRDIEQHQHGRSNHAVAAENRTCTSRTTNTQVNCPIAFDGAPVIGGSISSTS